MLTSALVFIIVLMILPTALGSLMLFHTLVRPKTPPADTSNRINHLRLVWFAMTREDKFADQFPWMKKDEWNNVN